MSVARAFLFPGQGAQVRGMAVDLAAAYPEAARVFERGKEILGRDILAVCERGPDSELNSTRVSQPAIFLHSMAVLEVLGRRWGAPGPFGRGLPASATAGLSLGEYSALVFAGSLEFEEALWIVGLRGEFMQKACDLSNGTMAAVLAFAPERVEEIVETARAEGLQVSVANYNSPEQTVVSGEVAAVDETVSRLQAAGARRVIRVNVAGAFHSPLMEPAARELEPVLRKATLQTPDVAFISNVTGRQVADPEEIREGLIRQVFSSVRWSQTMTFLSEELQLADASLLAERAPEEACAEARLSCALEIGPGRVLGGLFRKARKDFEVSPAGTCADLEALTELTPQHVPTE